MREILFRGKDMVNGEWVSGFLVDAHHIGDWVEAIPVSPETVGQFTGLTDKNGKKIFEGDILRIARRMDGIGHYYFPALKFPTPVAVKWDMCAWMWETICKDTQYYISFPEAWCHFECEVIGNIHDDPDLLEGGPTDV